MKTGLRFLLAATVSLVTATGLQASPITYTYIGQNFNQFSQTGPGPSNDISVMSAANYVTASLTMNGPISSEGVLGDFSAQVLDWSMTVNGPQG